MDFVYSNMVTLGSGNKEEHKLNVFNHMTKSTINNPFSDFSLTLASVDVSNSNDRNQTLGSYGMSIGDVSFNIFNDAFVLGDGRDQWWTSGINLSFNFEDGSNFTYRNDVFTGVANKLQTIPEVGIFYDQLESERIYNNESNMFNYQFGTIGLGFGFSLSGDGYAWSQKAAHQGMTILGVKIPPTTTVGAIPDFDKSSAPTKEETTNNVGGN